MFFFLKILKDENKENENNLPTIEKSLRRAKNTD